jgi:hypothetical protein
MGTPRLPRTLRFILVTAVASCLMTLAGCDDTPTTAVVENAFPAVSDAAPPAPTSVYPTSVYRVWWVATLFPNAISPGASSETERTIPAADYAYALLAPGWSPADGGAPRRLVAVRSASKLGVAAHGVLHIVVSADTFVGDCATGRPLDDADARLIVERIFPGEFAGATYDPATCATTVPAPDASATSDDGAVGDAADGP